MTQNANTSTPTGTSTSQHLAYLEKFSHELSQDFCDNSAYFDAINFVKKNLLSCKEHDDLARVAHRSQEIVFKLEHIQRLVDTALRNAIEICSRADALFYTKHHQGRLDSSSKKQQDY